MKNFLIALVIFLFWSVFALTLYAYFNPNDEQNSTKLASNNTTAIKTDTLVKAPKAIDTDTSTINTEKINQNQLIALNEQNDLIFKFNEGISFYKNDENISIPPSTLNFKYKILTYLEEHPNEGIVIQSFYDPTENIETPNLGIKRAQKLKQILLETQIPSQKIEIQSIIKSLPFNDNVSQGAIQFLFKSLNKIEKPTLEFILPDTKILYPKFIDDNIVKNDELALITNEVKTILSMHPQAIVEITGHTDYVGNAQDNYELGLRYAEQVKWFIVNNTNLSSGRIKVISKGESQPLVDNNTPEARNKNKRIEIKYIIDE